MKAIIRHNSRIAEVTVSKDQSGLSHLHPEIRVDMDERTCSVLRIPNCKNLIVHMDNLKLEEK